MDAEAIIRTYESIAALIGEMRIAANRGEWDRLIELEQEYRRQIDALDPEQPMPSDAVRQRVVQLIRKILEDDAEIRNQTKTWMGQLQNIMQSNRKEQQLNKMYGATG